MRARGLVAVALLAALLALAALWRSASRGDTRPGGAADGASAEPGASAELDEVAVPESLAPARTAPDAQRTALGSDASAPAGPCRLRIVRADSGAPVPGARVWLQREEVTFDSPEWKDAMGRTNDVEATLRAGLARELVADANGELLVPRPPRVLDVVAALDELHGEALLWPDQAETTIELAPDHALTVEVVDRSGRPVPGAAVVLFWGAFDPLESDEEYLADGAGRVWIPRLLRRVGFDERGPVRVAVAGRVPCEPPFVEVDPAAPPRAPVRLVVGEFGSVVVRCVDRRGGPLELDGRVSLTLSGGVAPTLAERAGSNLAQPLERGRARFPCVGLGLALDVYTLRSERELPGPTAAGEEKEVLLVVGEDAPGVRVRGTVRGIPSAWLAGSASRGGLLSGSFGRQARFLVHVSRPGPFECALWTSVEGPAPVGPWSLQLERPGGPVLRALVTPVADAAARTLDFGEVEFAPEPLLASVRVLDADGTPRGGAAVEAMGRSGLLRVPCDAEGRALVTGPTTSLPLQVCAIDRKRLTACATVAALGAELTLTLRAGAELRGSLVLPPGLTYDASELLVEVELALAGGGSDARNADIVDGARFRFAPLEPLPATLRVSWNGRPLVERGGIALADGATTELEPIDLRPLLTRFELEFEFADGTPWRGGTLRILDPLTDYELGTNGRALLFAPCATLDLQVWGRGARSETFREVHDGQRLELARGPALVVRAPRGVRAPERPFVLLVRATGWTDNDVASAVLGADGQARLEVPLPGTYSLSLSVRHEGTGEESAIEPSQRVEIGEQGGEVEAVLDPEALARALAEIGG